MGNNPTVLIIDDNRVTGTLLQNILAENGYQTLQAESGPDGRVLAQAHSPDLIFLDILMPDECGFETCGALKLDPRTVGIPIIFLSAVHEVDEKVKGLTLGAVDYITKPFNREELLARARLHIRLKQMYAASVREPNATAKKLQDWRQPASIKPQDFLERRPDPGRPPGALTNNKFVVSGANKKAFISSLQKQVVLSPGEYHVSKERVTIRTILGSCVAACLWDQPNGIIGMNHFLLASKSSANNMPFSQTEAGKYGIYAMELLINSMIKLGARRQNLRAKVFGGSSVLNSERADNFFCVGEANTNFIKAFLKTDGIPLISSDLGGSVGRVIYFSSEDFSVYVRKIGTARRDKIVLQEKTYWTKSIERQEKTETEPEIWL